jgi:hypothetical protein
MLLGIKTHVHLGLRVKGKTLEVKIYKTIVEKIVTCGAEPWAVTEEDIKD